MQTKILTDFPATATTLEIREGGTKSGGEKDGTNTSEETRKKGKRVGGAGLMNSFNEAMMKTVNAWCMCLM